MTINNYILSMIGEERPDPMNYVGVESVYLEKLWSLVNFVKRFSKVEIYSIWIGIISKGL